MTDFIGNGRAGDVVRRAAKLIRRRETYEDLTRCDVWPAD